MALSVGASEYRFLAPQLSEAGYRAVTVDLRGHGETSVPWKTYDVPSVGSDILALIDHLNAGPAHVIGTSFSPAAVVWAAAERPDCIRSLVLISPFVRDVKINPVMKALFWIIWVSSDHSWSVGWHGSRIGSPSTSSFIHDRSLRWTGNDE